MRKATKKVILYIPDYIFILFLLLLLVVLPYSLSWVSLVFPNILDVLGPRNSFFARPPIFLQHFRVFG